MGITENHCASWFDPGFVPDRVPMTVWEPLATQGNASISLIQLGHKPNHLEAAFMV